MYFSSSCLALHHYLILLLIQYRFLFVSWACVQPIFYARRMHPIQPTPCLFCLVANTATTSWHILAISCCCRADPEPASRSISPRVCHTGCYADDNACCAVGHFRSGAGTMGGEGSPAYPLANYSLSTENCSQLLPLHFRPEDETYCHSMTP